MKTQKRMIKKEQGITLVALIITIIVLIILAAVTINSIVQMNMIEKALGAAEKYEEEQQRETNIMNSVDEKIAELGGKKEPISKEESYVGYYADIDGNGTVDGIIYIDLVTGSSKEQQQWGDDNGKYTIETIDKENTKDYVISQENYNGSFGEKAVVTLVEGATGKDRFYVMTLEDFNNENETYHSWYAAAYNNGKGKLDLYITTKTIGSGKTNTEKMIEKWNNKAYGEQNTGSKKDIWGQIQEEEKKGWFIPSIEEWSAFGGELGITQKNCEQYGFSWSYWSSSIRNSSSSSAANFRLCNMQSYGAYDSLHVRLSTTF